MAKPDFSKVTLDELAIASQKVTQQSAFTTNEGIDIKPIYTEKDIEFLEESLPGFVCTSGRHSLRGLRRWHLSLGGNGQGLETPGETFEYPASLVPECPAGLRRWRGTIVL